MQDWLKTHKISQKLYETEEGKHSMYIDCVEMKMGRSSFCSEFEPIVAYDSAEKIKAYFSTL
jgi:hypothetical protein